MANFGKGFGFLSWGAGASGLAIGLLGFNWIFPATLLADTLKLKSGTTLEGELQGRVFSLKTKNGDVVQVPKTDVEHINIDKVSNQTPTLPPERGKISSAPTAPKGDDLFESLEKASKTQSGPPYATPLATFEKWRAAAISGDVDGMVDCYAAFRQGDMRRKLKKIRGKARRSMQKATAETLFQPGKPFYQGRSCCS